MALNLSQTAYKKVRFSKSVDMLKNGKFIMVFWSSRADGLTKEVYPTNSIDFKTTDAVLTGATIEQRADSYPQSVTFNSYIYETVNDLKPPLVYRQSPYLRVTATAANGTATFGNAATKPLNWNILDDAIFYVVFRKITTPLAAGDLKIVLRSTSGNFVTLTNTKTATAGTTTFQAFKFQATGAAGVAVTGTPNYTAINEMDIVSSVSGGIVEVMAIYVAPSENQLPNKKIAIDFHNMCVTELGLNYNIDTYEQMCGLDVEGIQATGFKPVYDIAMPAADLELISAAFGSTVRPIRMPIVETLERTVSAGTISVGAGRNIVGVQIGQINLAGGVTDDLIDTSSYFYNPVNTSIDVNATYNGSPAKIDVISEQVVDGYNVKGNKVGYIGQVMVKLDSNGNQNVKTFRAQLIPDNPDFANDADIVRKFKLHILDNNNTKYTEGYIA